MTDIKTASLNQTGFSSVPDKDILQYESTCGAHHYGRVELVVRKAEGPWLTDIDGNPMSPQELLVDPESAHRERDFTTINPDTSLNLHRPMIGEWLCMDSHVHYAGCGAGSAAAGASR